MAEKNIPLDHLRHSLAHVLASAVLEIFPDAKLGVGPVIENGFFYDFLLPRTLTPEDLKELQKRMRKLVGQRLAFERTEMSTAKAKEFFREREQPFKVELIEDIEKFGTTKASEILGGSPPPQSSPTRGEEEKRGSPPLAGGARGGGQKSVSPPARGGVRGGGSTVTLYKTGKFIDLCRGGHVENTSEIDARAFKLDKIAGAYWRGNEKNPQLQRIYGLAFQSAEELQAHLTMLEEAKKRDHRKLGEELDLFKFSDLVGPGLPLWTPKGNIIREELERWAKETEEKWGYVRVATPHIAKHTLFEISGHLPYYKDDMYSPMDIDGEEYYLKGMNCPHHHMIFKSSPKSYRDLPLRYAEYGMVYRYEQSGTLFGLMRVRAIEQNDAHIYCTEEQAEDEFLKVLKLHEYYYRTIGLKKDDYHIVVGLPDEAKRSKYHGDKALWDKAERMMRAAIKKSGIRYVDDVGGAAFYGPKIDVVIKSSIGREFAISTNQVDLYMPTRFNLEYTDKKGNKKLCAVIHRAPLGSHERFIGFLIEHYAGAFPVWLAPVQVYVAPVGKAHYGAARKLGKLLSAQGMRVEVDEARETIPYKVRKAEKQKIPYVLVVGDREKSLKKLTVRIRGQERQPQMTLSAFVKRVKREIEKKQ